MKKLIAAVALATVCLFGVPQNTMVSHAEMTWQVESAREETQGDMTYLFYPNADGQTCWLYQIKVAENADVSTLEIPETIGGLQVTRIGYERQSDYCKNILGQWVQSFHGVDGANEVSDKVKKIVIPETVTEVESQCFSGFDYVTSVKLPSKVTKLESDVFYGCDRLKSITLPDSLKEMEISAFFKCKKLNRIKISEQNPNFVTEDGCILSKDKKTLYFVFSDKKTFQIPSTVTLVKSNAFWVCLKVEKVEISKNVKELERFALQSFKIENVTVNKKNKAFKKDGQSIYRTSDNSLAVAIAPEGKEYIMSDKVKKLTTNVSLIGAGRLSLEHEGVRLKKLVLSKNLKYVESNCLFDSREIHFQSAKPPKFKDKHAVPIFRYVYVPKKSAAEYKKVYKSQKRWKHVKDNWKVY